MTETITPPRRGKYGIDAPIGPIFMGVIAALNFALAIPTGSKKNYFAGFFVLCILGLYLHGTLRGKFVLWAGLLDQLKLRGDERLLDMGCGRGAVLLMAAQRLTTGRAVGVDLWIKGDQSGNALDVTQKNAVAEGVTDRVELHTGNMMALPFEDASFDVVVSSFAIHNITGRAGKEKAISEAVRVLRPGGRLMIVDVRNTGIYQEQLTRIGMSDVVCRWLGLRYLMAKVVTASKPERRT